MNTGSGLAIERVAETGSTNSDLLERIRILSASGAGSLEPVVLVADRQSAGRGRHGRNWLATPGASLTFSLAWPFARADLSGLSLAVGTVLADSLDAAGAPPRIGLKWPNDVCLLDAGSGSDALHGRKLAGVLIETAPLGARRVAVIGVGLNVLPQEVADAASGCACWAEIEAAATPDAALARVITPLAAALERFEAEGFAAFAAAFAERDLLRGRRIVASGPRGPVEGIAAGVSARGELLLQAGEGVISVRSGEVRVRLAGAADEASPWPQRAGSPC
jgi:BirA family biotin operon repressor/biotin-[acetyl-CoA-carboxylase] ligase